jgi:hypothetical protein
MNLAKLSAELENSVDARETYKGQMERANRILDAMRKIFSTNIIADSEIKVPITIECHNDRHTEHALSLNRLMILHRHKDGAWDYGEDDLHSIHVLKIIVEKADELIAAAKAFQVKETAKTKEVKEFLDIVEEALQPILVAEKLKEGRR